MTEIEPTVGKEISVRRPKVVSSDPEEQRLRDLWYKYKAEMEDGEDGAVGRFHQAHNELASYLWNRTEKDIERDRAQHPKAKRNAPKYQGGSSGERALP